MDGMTAHDYGILHTNLHRVWGLRWHALSLFSRGKQHWSPCSSQSLWNPQSHCSSASTMRLPQNASVLSWKQLYLPFNSLSTAFNTCRNNTIHTFSHHRKHTRYYRCKL